jgi:hypothetical protein
MTNKQQRNGIILAKAKVSFYPEFLEAVALALHGTVRYGAAFWSSRAAEFIWQHGKDINGGLPAG